MILLLLLSHFSRVRLCVTLSDPMDCSLPGSSAHGIFQARVLEWGAIAFSAYDLREVIKHKVEDMCFISAIRTNALLKFPIFMAPITPKNSIMSINTLS